MITRYILLLLVLFIAGCSDENASVDNKVEKTVIDPQIKALEKAKGVEQMLLDDAEKQRKYIDSQ